jgi:transcriptional regulator with XRE-family HTH domain
MKGLFMSDIQLLELKVNLSTNIKNLRKLKGLAQERLALEAGVDRTLVSKIERVIANPSLEIMHKLAKCLDVTVIELLKTPK